MPTALVTGASAGIGAALARELARRGYAVGLVARRAELLAPLAEEIRAAGGRAAWAAADVLDRAQLDAAVHAVVAELGPVDLLVANAGTGLFTRAERAPVDAWLGVFHLNVDGVVHSVGAVLPAMVERGAGHLAVVSSLAGYRGLPGNAAYSGSKAAVTAFFESLRVDLKKHGVAVTTIHPGFIKTPLTDKNRFPMPFLISAEDAARRIADGLVARRSEVNFPWPTAWAVSFARFLPNWLWDWIVGGRRVG